MAKTICTRTSLALECDQKGEEGGFYNHVEVQSTSGFVGSHLAGLHWDGSSAIPDRSPSRSSIQIQRSNRTGCHGPDARWHQAFGGPAPSRRRGTLSRYHG